MKIINGGKKDYYDYLVGKFGLDNEIVYDRRDGIVLVHDKWNHELLQAFSKEELYDDLPKYEHYVYEDMWFHKKYCGKLIGVDVCYGDVVREFIVERYLDDLGKIHLDVNEKSCGKWNRYFSEDRSKYGPVVVRIDKHVYNNAILNGTWITGLINPEEMYYEIYNYLMAQKNKEIVDNRTDIQKLESKGFDKMSSFRNPVHNANAKRKIG